MSGLTPHAAVGADANVRAAADAEALGTHDCLTPQVADKKRAGRSAEWWCGSGLGARASPPARSGAVKGPGGRGGNGTA